MCDFPDCDRPVIARGLCAAHYAQLRRGRELAPLRNPHGQIGDHPQELIPGLRVSRECRRMVVLDPSGARQALERWARGRGES